VSRNLKITLGILVGAVLLGLLSLHGLHQSVQRLAEGPASEEQARLAVVAPPISTPTDVNTTAHIFWRSTAALDRLDPVDISIPLSADTAVRARQLLHALIVSAPTEDQKTLPEDITVLGFYDHQDAGEQCKHAASPEDSDSRPGSGYARRPRRFDGFLRHASRAGRVPSRPRRQHPELNSAQMHPSG